MTRKPQRANINKSTHINATHAPNQNIYQFHTLVYLCTYQMGLLEKACSVQHGAGLVDGG